MAKKGRYQDSNPGLSDSKAQLLNYDVILSPLRGRQNKTILEGIVTLVG